MKKFSLTISIFFIFLASLIFSKKVTSQEAKSTLKKSIAIAEIENTTVYDDPALPKRFASLIESELVKLKRFEVIEREQLEKILKEQNLSLSGFLSSLGGEKVGKIKGVDAILTGKITDLFIVPEKNEYKWTDKKGVTHYSYSVEIKTKIEVALKLIDVATGQILIAENQDGFVKNTLSKSDVWPSDKEVNSESVALISKASSKCVDKIINSIERIYPLEGTVLSIEGKDIYIDIGSAAGLQPKQKLIVERVVRTLTHPTTGQVIGKVKNKIAEIEVTELYELYSKAKIKKVEKGQQIQQGDVCVSSPE